MSELDDRPTAVELVDPRDLAATLDDALIGVTIHDTYKVVRFLAEGGMGRVYEAQHTRLENKRFAIKVLHAELKHSVEVRMRFRREAEAAASIDHPNVVGVHDFGYAAEGWPYLVCDLLEGRELAEVLDARQPLPTHIAVSIARQLASALEAAHERGVIHRDVKPANVFLVGPSDKPEVKVLDFGLSRIVELQEANVTRTGVVMGTPAYMSPEQARGERVDHRTDVYGVGVVLYACLTGRPPYEEASAQKAILAVLSREPERPCAIVPSIPAELELIVQKAMARDPAERYPTMKELELALARFEESRPPFKVTPPGLHDLANAAPAPLALTETPEASEARGVRRRAVGWLVLAATLLLVGAWSAALGVLEILYPGRALSPTELLLVTVAVVGSLTTPGILFIRWLGRRYWGNSARMVKLVASVRGPVVAAAVVYGVASLVGRMLDATHPHVAGAPAPDASGWLGWAPLLFLVGLFAAVAVLGRERILGPSPSLARRLLAGPVLLGLIGAGGAAVLASGFRMSPNGPRAEIVAPPDAPRETSEAPETDGSAPGAATPATTAVATEPPVGRAPDEALAAAVEEGLAALTALQAQYPDDPRVLEPLARELGKDAGRASELLRVLDALFHAAPERAEDPDLGMLVQVAAVAPATSQRAIELMRDRMGLRGAEMLFDLVLARPEVRPRARAALETAEVQRRLSPALKIAFDLHIGVSCDARVGLLPEAVRHGDERAIGVLKMLTTPTLRGCGYKKLKPCPAPCGGDAAAMNQAAAQIRARLAETAPGGQP